MYINYFYCTVQFHDFLTHTVTGDIISSKPTEIKYPQNQENLIPKEYPTIWYIYTNSLLSVTDTVRPKHHCFKERPSGYITRTTFTSFLFLCFFEFSHEMVPQTFPTLGTFFRRQFFNLSTNLIPSSQYYNDFPLHWPLSTHFPYIKHLCRTWMTHLKDLCRSLLLQSASCSY